MSKSTDDAEAPLQSKRPRPRTHSSATPPGPHEAAASPSSAALGPEQARIPLMRIKQALDRVAEAYEGKAPPAKHWEEIHKQVSPLTCLIVEDMAIDSKAPKTSLNSDSPCDLKSSVVARRFGRAVDLVARADAERSKMLMEALNLDNTVGKIEERCEWLVNLENFKKGVIGVRLHIFSRR